MPSYMAHSDLPQPAIFKYVKPRHDELASTLQNFLDLYAANASKLTIDDDNVGRGLVCAFADKSSKVEGVMLYVMKQDIQNYLEKQGFKCTSSSGSELIQCVKSKTLAKL